MTKSKKTNKGMAIVIVLCFSAILLAYGTISVNQYKYSAPVSKMHLDRIQADFFAKGMQNIILFKVKKFPDFFLRSYRQMKWDKRTDIPDENKSKYDPPVYNNFINDDIFGGDTGVGKDEYWNETMGNKGTPLKYFKAELELLNALDFNNETIRITVDIKFDGRDAINKYVAVVNGDMKVASISASVEE